MRLFNNFQHIVGDKFNLNLRQLKQAKEQLSGYNPQWVKIFFEEAFISDVHVLLSWFYSDFLKIHFIQILS